MQFGRQLKRLLTLPWIGEALALIGGFVYLIQSWIYAHTQASILDEGAYLVKGLLFATGRYQPYQAYGPWTNHMPLSFLIPGYTQVVFGPGLRTGRYISIVLGGIFLLGLWFVSRRLGGKWWAAASIWVVTINPFIVKTYTPSSSQGLIACMLIWVFALTLGGKRSHWQLVVGSILAGLILLTRINLAPLLPILIVYIFWAYGWRSGVWSAFAGLITVLVGHAVFFPGILKMWANWLPGGLTPFLDAYRPPIGATPSWNPTISIVGRMTSFLQGIRLNFFAVIGVFGAWLLWPRRKDWQSESRYKISVLLSFIFLILLLLHAWATLGKNYCVYCFQVYLTFFASSGILLVIVSFPSWRRKLTPWRHNTLIVTILTTSMVLGYSTYNVVGRYLITNVVIRKLLLFQIPRIRQFQIQPGTIEVWGLIANKFNLTYNQVFQVATGLLRMFLPALLGLLFGLIIIIVARKLRGISWGSISFPASPGVAGFIIFLVAGTILSVTVGGGDDRNDCGWDVIAAYEQGGEHLAGYIPEGASIYWRGGLSPIPLLYLPNVELFPSQLNDGYSYRLGGDPSQLEKYGWWSAELAEQWAYDADFVLIEDRWFGELESEVIESGFFDELSPTHPLIPCRDDSQIHIYQRSR